MLGREETHHPGQEAVGFPRVFSLKLFHPFVELAHFFRVRLSPQMRLDGTTVVSVSKSHGLVLLLERDLLGHLISPFD
jgi:hypothetical protein